MKTLAIFRNRLNRLFEEPVAMAFATCAIAYHLVLVACLADTNMSPETRELVMPMMFTILGMGIATGCGTIYMAFRICDEAEMGFVDDA